MLNTKCEHFQSILRSYSNKNAKHEEQCQNSKYGKTDTPLLNKSIDSAGSSREIPYKVQNEMLATEYRANWLMFLKHWLQTHTKLGFRMKVRSQKGRKIYNTEVENRRENKAEICHRTDREGGQMKELLQKLFIKNIYIYIFTKHSWWLQKRKSRGGFVGKKMYSFINPLIVEVQCFALLNR